MAICISAPVCLFTLATMLLIFLRNKRLMMHHKNLVESEAELAINGKDHDTVQDLITTGGNLLRYLTFLATRIYTNKKFSSVKLQLDDTWILNFAIGYMQSDLTSICVIYTKHGHYVCMGRSPIEITCFIYGLCHGHIYSIPQMLVWSFLKAICSDICII